MGWQTDAAIAYDNQLKAAERHMDATETPDMSDLCKTCAHFRRLDRFDADEIRRCLPMDVEDRDGVAKRVTRHLGVCALAVSGDVRLLGNLTPDDYGCEWWEGE